APVLPRLLALTAVASAALAAPTAHAGETPVNAWLGATDGDWTDPTRWSLGMYPGNATSSPADIRIDAAGTPYTVLVDAFISRGIKTLTVDSPDASVLLEDGTMGASLPSTPGFDHFNVNQGTLRIERYGTLAFRAAKNPSRIGQSASLRIGDTRLTTANISGPLVNEGAISIGDTSRLRIGDISSGGSLYNSTSGEISLARDSELRFASLTNDGVIRVIGDSALLSTTSIEGINAYFENRGLFHAQRGVEI